MTCRTACGRRSLAPREGPPHGRLAPSAARTSARRRDGPPCCCSPASPEPPRPQRGMSAEYPPAVGDGSTSVFGVGRHTPARCGPGAEVPIGSCCGRARSSPPTCSSSCGRTTRCAATALSCWWRPTCPDAPSRCGARRRSRTSSGPSTRAWPAAPGTCLSQALTSVGRPPPSTLMHRRYAKRGMRTQMRVRSPTLCALTPPVVALALGASACGGGGSTLTDGGQQSRSNGSASGGQAAAGVPTGPVAAWPQARLLRRLAGEVVHVEGRRVHIDRATITCQGDGPGSRHGHKLAWQSFSCIQPTFGGEGPAGPDAVFRVQPTGPRSFRITRARFMRY
jgi:hypothetical protein